jgi:hypothetical protein
MEPRRITVFFYGLFMDAEALRTKGLHPNNARPAQVQGMALRIGKRAALTVSPASCTYGILMDLTHSEIDQLYAESSVAMYRPEAVMAKVADDSRVAALCFNLPSAPAKEEENPGYAAKLREVARRLGLPASYVDSLR